MKLPHRSNFCIWPRALPLCRTMSQVAWAQTYPSRPIRLVIPFPPGGVYDATGRPWADKVKSHLGTIVVENRRCRQFARDRCRRPL